MDNATSTTAPSVTFSSNVRKTASSVPTPVNVGSFSVERDMLRRLQCAMRIYEDRGRAFLDSWDGVATVRGMNIRHKCDILEELLVSNRDDWDKLYSTLQRIKQTSVSSVASLAVEEEEEGEEDQDED